MGFTVTVQNTARGHSDYFKLQEFERTAEEESHSNLPPYFSPETGHKTLLHPKEGNILITEDKGTLRGTTINRPY